jgi:hypothetical protein
VEKMEGNTLSKAVTIFEEEQVLSIPNEGGID